jgi:hypothetical protein
MARWHSLSPPFHRLSLAALGLLRRRRNGALVRCDVLHSLPLIDLVFAVSVTRSRPRLGLLSPPLSRLMMAASGAAAGHRGSAVLSSLASTNNPLILMPLSLVLTSGNPSYCRSIRPSPGISGAAMYRRGYSSISPITSAPASIRRW